MAGPLAAELKHAAAPPAALTSRFLKPTNYNQLAKHVPEQGCSDLPLGEPASTAAELPKPLYLCRGRTTGASKRVSGSPPHSGGPRKECRRGLAAAGGRRRRRAACRLRPTSRLCRRCCRHDRQTAPGDCTAGGARSGRAGCRVLQGPRLRLRATSAQRAGQGAFAWPLACAQLHCATPPLPCTAWWQELCCSSAPHACPSPQVLSDLSRAEVAAAQLHREFRELEKRHTGAQLGLASLEARCTAPLLKGARHPCLWRGCSAVQGLTPGLPPCSADPAAGGLRQLRPGGHQARRPQHQRVRAACHCCRCCCCGHGWQLMPSGCPLLRLQAGVVRADGRAGQLRPGCERGAVQTCITVPHRAACRGAEKRGYNGCNSHFAGGANEIQNPGASAA